MSPDQDVVGAVKRAGSRAVYHLLKAGIESLKAVEAVIDELGTLRDQPAEDEDGEGRVEIEVE